MDWKNFYYFKNRTINILFEGVKSNKIVLDFILGGKVHPIELIKNISVKNYVSSSIKLSPVYLINKIPIYIEHQQLQSSRLSLQICVFLIKFFKGLFYFGRHKGRLPHSGGISLGVIHPNILKGFRKLEMNFSLL